MTGLKDIKVHVLLQAQNLRNRPSKTNDDMKIRKYEQQIWITGKKYIDFLKADRLMI